MLLVLPRRFGPKFKPSDPAVKDALAARNKLLHKRPGYVRESSHITTCRSLLPRE